LLDQLDDRAGRLLGSKELKDDSGQHVFEMKQQYWSVSSE
jgi:hypothetical protein